MAIGVVGLGYVGLPLVVAFAEAGEEVIAVDVDQRLDLPIILPPVPDLVDLEEAKILIADDVADTGATLALVKEFCAPRVGQMRIATLYEKPRSVVKCDYVWRRTDRWIVFPWSAQPALTPKASAPDGPTA